MRGTQVKRQRLTGKKKPGRKNGGHGASNGSGVGGGIYWATQRIGRMARKHSGHRR